MKELLETEGFKVKLTRDDENTSSYTYTSLIVYKYGVSVVILYGSYPFLFAVFSYSFIILFAKDNKKE